MLVLIVLKDCFFVHIVNFVMLKPVSWHLVNEQADIMFFNILIIKT